MDGVDYDDAASAALDDDGDADDVVQHTSVHNVLKLRPALPPLGRYNVVHLNWIQSNLQIVMPLTMEINSHAWLCVVVSQSPRALLCPPPQSYSLWSIAIPMHCDAIL